MKGAREAGRAWSGHSASWSCWGGGSRWRAKGGRGVHQPAPWAARTKVSLPARDGLFQRTGQRGDAVWGQVLLKKTASLLI
jgi:hypothetical protein